MKIMKIEELAKILVEKIMDFEIFMFPKSNFKFNKQQLWELVVLDLFNITKVVESSVEDVDKCRKLLDEIHSIIYYSVCETEQEIEKFENLIQERYSEYLQIYKINSESSISMSLFGNIVISHVMDDELIKKEKELFLSWAGYVEEIFYKIYLKRKTFFKEILEQYEINN